MNTLYELTDVEFESFSNTLEWHKLRSARAQREFETFAVNYGFSFPDSYEYKNQNTQVKLVCINAHIVIKTPNSFRVNFSCNECKKLEVYKNIDREVRVVKNSVRKSDLIKKYSGKEATLKNLISRKGGMILKISSGDK
ncbi:hypothetical protein LZI70_15820 [Vibrio pelagius]|uniref:Uncharacterized protein n=1 Tax=Vibrio pelagius TaxID=28169 RepID=A0ABY5G9K9_VIBPE|nr:hypothetical protein [Vibrio pelagius]UTT86888.1 hypothetical protein LZI70_15820 [Vibrio pelagius]